MYIILKIVFIIIFFRAGDVICMQGNENKINGSAGNFQGSQVFESNGIPQ